MKFRTLSRTLVIKVLLASSVITTLMTVVSFYLDYRAEMGNLDKVYMQIEHTSLQSIANAVFIVDESALGASVHGLKNMTSVLEVKVIDLDGEVLFSSKDEIQTDQFLFDKTYPLISNGEELGKLAIKGTMLHIYEELVRKGAVFFVTQGIKTVLISLILFYIFKYYVTNHLENLASQLKSKQESHSPIRLDKKGLLRDELDILQDEYNSLIAKVREKEDEQAKEIELHKATALNSARLASLGEMATGIAHEINNPLAIIEGSGYVIRKRIIKNYSNDQHLSTQAHRVIETSKRISNIVSNLKAYSRDASKDQYFREPLKAIIQQSVELCRARFENSKRTLQVGDIPDVEIHCRRTEIVQTMVNLMNNAFDATERTPKKTIEVRVTANDYSAYISVIDTGSGLTEEVKKRMFDPFYSTKDVGNGTGLGLSISQAIVLQHSGKIECFETEGGDTCFRIYLPLATLKAAVNA